MRAVPNSCEHVTFPWASYLLTWTDQLPALARYCTAAPRSLRTSLMKASTVSAGIHTAPSLGSMDAGGRSSGMTRSRARTFDSYAVPAASAACSLRFTLPDR